MKKPVTHPRILPNVVVGLTLLLVLWECTFTAYDALTLTLPGLGSVTLADVALAGLAGLYIYSALSLSWHHDWSRTDGWALAMMGWLLLAAIANIFFGTFTVTLLLRYSMRLALLWMLFSLIRRLGAIEVRRLVVGLVIISLTVCAVHAYIVLAQRTDLVLKWYYAFSRSEHRLELDRLALGLNADFTSNWPGGGLLMSSLAVGALCGLLTARTHKHLWFWVVCVLVGSFALMVSLSRSRLIVLWVLVPVLLLWRTRAEARLYRRLALMAVLVSAGALGVFMFSPALQAAVVGKFERLSDTSDASFTMRWLDTEAAIKECAERPLAGKGLAELSAADSVFAGDTHGAAALVLMAGVPALFLLGMFAWSVWRQGRGRGDALGVALQYVFLHMLLLFVFNVEPLIVCSRGLIPLVIVTGLLAQRPALT